MDKSRKIITILLFFKSTVKAQDTTSQRDMNPLHPSLAVVLVVLSIMFCITFVIVAYAKFCHRHVPYDPNLVQDPDGIVRTRSRFSGIDRSIIESLPFFQFSSLKGSKEGLECAVCLSRFEETEILRLLPKCRHAFHMNCIDKWLENHSSCPLCRYKFDVGDLKYLTYTNSFRNQHIPSDDQNLEFYIQREQNHEKSSRFNNPFQKFSKGKRPEEPLIQKFKNEHKFQHKIIVSDVIYKSRWSEVNSSDILSLKSEMLNVISSKRFSSPKGSNSGRFTNEISAKEHILKIKDDMEWKRLYESKISKAEKTSSDQSSTSEQCTILPRLVDSDKKRSMSEITNISRFAELSSMNGLSTPASIAKNEKIRRVWLPIARKTIQRFAGHERSLLDTSKHGINDV